MADFNQINQFGSAKPTRSGEGTSCAECEAMLMDALDGVLSAKEKAAFDRHIATCSDCGQMLLDAQRGASLLEMLKFPRPEPSSALLERILSQTATQSSSSAMAAKSSAAGLSAIPFVDGAALELHGAIPNVSDNVLPFRPKSLSRFNLRAITHTMMQPRLAMTAAMAFFSITLTMNLTGVHPSDLKASDLTPSNLKHSFYHANASVVRYYDNLRVVYELESRVNELKRTNDSENSPAPGKSDTKDGSDKDQAKPRKTPKSGSGTSERLVIPERHDPLGQQLKFAGYIRNEPADRAVADNTARARPSNKLKEPLQEGDLV